MRLPLSRFALGGFSQAVIVDDASGDPALHFIGPWQRESMNGVMNNTLTLGESTNSSVVFNFVGTAVAAIGAIPANQIWPTSTYTLDGSFSNTFPSEIVTSFQSNITFFSASSLSPGQHTLVITLTTSADAPYMLDYIAYQPLVSITSSSTSDPATGFSASSSSSTGVGTSSSDTVYPSLLPIPSAPPANAPSKARSHTPAIIGGVVGAVVGLIIILILVMIRYWLKRRPSGDPATNHRISVLSPTSVRFLADQPQTYSTITPRSRMPLFVRNPDMDTSSMRSGKSGKTVLQNPTPPYATNVPDGPSGYREG